MRPRDVIPRIRSACPIFGNRVAGAKGVAQALSAEDLAVPQCIVVVMGVTATGEATLGPHDPEMLVQLAALVCVANDINDERGQGSAEALLDCFMQLRNALQDWTPDADRFGPIQMDALTLDGETYSRARAWAQVDFASTVPLSKLI